MPIFGRRKTKTLIVNKVGESLYLCRTCLREYNSSMELCVGCYTAESKKHHGHEFAQLMVQRATDMPDDQAAQLKNWWRCNFPGCNLGKYCPQSRLPLDVSLTQTVTGPSVEWLHKHAEARLCLGDAMIDQCRENAGQQCLKTFSYRSRLTGPANPTNMKCQICLIGEPLSLHFTFPEEHIQTILTRARSPFSRSL